MRPLHGAGQGAYGGPDFPFYGVAGGLGLPIATEQKTTIFRGILVQYVSCGFASDATPPSLAAGRKQIGGNAKQTGSV